ncbi:MAG: ABC transporter permease [Acidobacteriota bacterium]
MLLRQMVSVTLTQIKSLPQRLGPSLVAMVGIAGVVLVMVAVLAIAQGLLSTLDASGDEDQAIVLRDGADTELTSGLQLDQTRIIADTEGIVRGSESAAASAELFVVVNLDKRSTGTDANVPLRGVEPAAFDIRNGFEILDGRNFVPGRREIIVGQGALAEFSGIDLGSTLRLGVNDWEIVGTFAAGGSAFESELWTDARVLQPAYRRGNSFQSVYARLDSPESFDSFKAQLEADPRLNVKVERLSNYFNRQGALLTGWIRAIAVLLAIVMGLGALFAAVNTMYSAVANRTREIATLRALGFSPLAVLTAVMTEAMVLALGGGVLGGLAAYLAFDGTRAATLNWQSFSQITFAFDVTPQILVSGAIVALILGFFGGLLPAVRAARIPIATGLRER